jgi:hypothetical protein
MMKVTAGFEKFKELMQAIEKAKLKYVVVAGFAIEGRRRKLTRKHSDIDVLLLKTDAAKIEALAVELKYKMVDKSSDNYLLKSADGTRLDFYLAGVEGEKAVCKGRILTYAFPKEFIETDLQKGIIQGFIFTIPSDSFLKKMAYDSQSEQDKAFAATLLGDAKKIGLIRRIPRPV